MKKYTRRQFLRDASLAAIAFSAVPKIPKLFAETNPNLSVVEGDDPFKNTVKVIEQIGGMARFVKRGDVVVVKPNIGWDRRPEQAADTNPFVVGALVKMAYDAGAKKVKVLDNTCNEARRCYKNSGIEEEARKYGASVLYVEDFMLKEMDLKGEVLKKWMVYKDFVECDCLINVPILKNHGLSGLTIGMKNLMGAVGGRRGLMHMNIDKSVVDLARFFKPRLTVMDAYRILLRSGPQGGSLDDVALKRMIVAGADQVAVDAYGAKIFGRNANDFGFIKTGHMTGLGNMNINKMTVKVARL